MLLLLLVNVVILRKLVLNSLTIPRYQPQKKSKKINVGFTQKQFSLKMKLPQFLILLSLLPILLNIVPLFFSGTDAAARPSKNLLKQCETQPCVIITEKDMTQLINDQVLTRPQVDHLLQYHNHIPTEPTTPTDPPVPPKEQKEPSPSQTQTQIQTEPDTPPPQKPSSSPQKSEPSYSVNEILFTFISTSNVLYSVG